jgi:hypothetical protein
MGAPLRSRNSFTWAAVTFVVLVLIFLFPSGCFFHSCGFAPNRFATRYLMAFFCSCCSGLSAQAGLALRSIFCPALDRLQTSTYVTCAVLCERWLEKLNWPQSKLIR